MTDALAEQRRELARVTARAWELMEAEPVEAGSLAARALELAARLEDGEAEARNRLVLGSALVAKAAYEDGRRELHRALGLAKEAGDQALMVSVLRVLLKCHFYRREIDAAMVTGMQALQLARDSGDRQREALTHNDLGLLYGNLGDVEEALDHLLTGLRIAREAGSKKLASVLNNIGNVYLQLGDHQEALGFFQEALESFREEGMWRGEGIALGNVGRARLGMGEPAAAVDALEESLALYEARGDHVYATPALARLATARAAAGDEEGARAAFLRSLEAVAESAHREFEDEIVAAAGRFHLGRGELEEATDLLSRALALLPPGEATRGAYELHEGLAEAYERQGDLGRALAHYKEFHRLRQAVADAVVTVRTRGLMLQFDVERARQNEEIFRLRNVELARANRELQALHEQLEEKNRELHQISIEDALTGLSNRRYLDLQLDVEIERARRHQRPLCAAMCDVDNFKAINDELSHAVGDEILRRVGQILRESARQTDIVARFGGDEFLLILPDTDLAGAIALTERIRTLVRQHGWAEVASGLQVTLSIGLTELSEGAGASRLLAEADARLYEAKRAGRDRVVA